MVITGPELLNDKLFRAAEARVSGLSWEAAANKQTMTGSELRKIAYDELNQQARATFTFLKYELSLMERAAGNGDSGLQMIKENLHARPPCRKNPRRGIFQRQALGGANSQQACRVQEDIRCRLAPGHFRCAEQFSFESRQQAGKSQGRAHLVVVAT